MGQLGATAQSRPTTLDRIREVCISGVRPRISITGPTTSRASPSPKVAADTLSALSAADSPNRAARLGSSGWVE